MSSLVLSGLYANAATLGVHWIYDHAYLKALSIQQSLLFLTQDEAMYKKAKTAYFSYPHQKLGDVSVQGNILIWLYQALKDNPDLSLLAYSNLLYAQFKPGGPYVGYVESYSKKHVLGILAKSLEIDVERPLFNDDHLVGFMPYLACKALGLSKEKAWEFTKLYTEDVMYLAYFNMFDHLLSLLKTKTLKEAIVESITYAPESEKEKLIQATRLSDTKTFIETYAGRACQITQSVPVIIHMLYHSTSYQQVVSDNILVGGAIADRNTLIGVFAGQVYDVEPLFLNDAFLKLNDLLT